ncbi:hypothetical protein JW979_10380, partial [bacterium]|nr:hypothetical protein [candidate division CSSED10-310 bacterium]
MLFRRTILLMVLISLGVGGVFAEEQAVPPFTGFPEVTDFGSFLCDLAFWRGLPPCFKESSMHGSFVRYPTRMKALVIVESFEYLGLYQRDLLVSFFGSLCTGAYQPIQTVEVGDYWDASYYALDLLDRRVEAKTMLMDIAFDRGWAKGKFPDQRYKALKVLSQERVITLREYKPLLEYLDTEL